MDIPKRSASESPDDEQKPRKVLKRTEESDSETDNSGDEREYPKSPGPVLPSSSELSSSLQSSSAKSDEKRVSFQLETDLQSYTAESELGSGSYGTVYKARRSSDNEYVALKFLDKSAVNQENIEHEESLAVMLMQNPHQNIMVFHETFETESGTYLISELSPIGDIFEVMQIENDLGNKIWIQFDEYLSRHLIIGIARGLQHLHALRIAHGDLKLHNVLLFLSDVDSTVEQQRGITRIDRWTPKLCDFSNCQIGDRDNPNEPILRDEPYCAPVFAAPESYDITEGIQYDSIIADIFSLGCCLLSMLMGTVPFDPPMNSVDSKSTASSKSDGSSNESTAQYNKFANKLKYDTGFKSQLYKVCSFPLRNLLGGLLEANPQNRMSLDQFFAHEWITRPKSREFEDVSGKLSYLSTHPYVEGIQFLTYASDY